jgi:uncharacterized protein (TIGR02268 family)
MSPLPATLLTVVLLQQAPSLGKRPTAPCEEIQRIELSRGPAMTREVCIARGLLTGFVFDLPVFVELQDEVRFAEVTRGRGGISFLPPRDLASGERLRLTAHLTEGTSQQSVTFTLVARQGQATHQVEVYRDQRTRESYLEEVDQEQAKSQRLGEENEGLQNLLAQMRAPLGPSTGLLGLHRSGAMDKGGVRAAPCYPVNRAQPERGLGESGGDCYRSKTSAALEVWINNTSTEPWTAAGASLTTARGETLDGLKLWQANAIAPQTRGKVFVEVSVSDKTTLGELTLSLWELGPRAITIPHLSMPD